MERESVIAKDINGNNHTVSTKSLVWRPAVYAIIVVDDRILLSPQGGYDLPGGGVKMYESIGEALIREVKEETGYEVIVGKLVAVKEVFWNNIRKKTNYHSVAIYYTATITGGELSNEWFQGHEKNYMSLAEWIGLEELPNLKIKNTIDWRPIVQAALSK